MGKNQKKKGGAEWFTPPDIIQLARQVMGDIALDPASCDAANQIVRARRIFTEQYDGLSQPWIADALWLNPPYAAPMVKAFVRKLMDEVTAGNVKEAILLVTPATDAAWWQQLWRLPICFVRGRIKFVSSDGSRPDNPTHASAFVYLGPNAASFAAVFGGIGHIVLPSRSVA